jgi:YHS domain-containing protein
MFSLMLALAVTASPQANPVANTVCPVCQVKVDGENSAVALRGKEYRLCCAGCGDSLAKEPDSYLETDGTPKKAAKHHSWLWSHNPGYEPH